MSLPCSAQMTRQKMQQLLRLLAATTGLVSASGCLVPPGMTVHSQPRMSGLPALNAESPNTYPQDQARVNPRATREFNENQSQHPNWNAQRLASNDPFTGNLTPTFFQPVKDNTWRTRVPALVLFPLVVRHLSESYIVSSTNPATFSVQTDWDKFFIGGRLFRNRMNISMFQVSPSMTEIVINNKVEYFQSANEQANYGDSDWIPTQDITNEKTSLIENLSQSLQAIHFNSARR